MERFNFIYEQYMPSVYRYIFLLVRNKEIAEDLTQDTFMKVYTHLQTFSNHASIHTWIIQIARNTTYDYFRKNKWSSLFALKDGQVEQVISSEQIILVKQETYQLYDAIASLKREYQEVIILRKINELSIDETARILGWTENKVKAKQQRALKKLKEKLEMEGEFDAQSKRA